jgi:hypothetical protein
MRLLLTKAPQHEQNWSILEPMEIPLSLLFETCDIIIPDVGNGGSLSLLDYQQETEVRV